ncbi:MAG: hypothetical protein ACOYOL_11085, partial [Chthoniobacterales bacterium]
MRKRPIPREDRDGASTSAPANNPQILPQKLFAVELGLDQLPSVTPARARALREAGLVTVLDLLRHYPRRHEDRRKFIAFPDQASPDAVCLRGIVLETKMAR